MFFIFGLYNFHLCKEYVGAGISTLMSISDGFGHVQFLSKDGKGASYEEEMDGKVVHSPPDSLF